MRSTPNRIVFVLAVACALSGCLSKLGGSNAESRSAVTNSGTVGGEQTLAPVDQRAFTAAADGERVASLKIADAEGVASTGRIETFGQAFPQGLLRGHVVVRDGARMLPTQVDVKRRHLDGSVRHAIITTMTPALGAGETRALELVASSSTQPAGSVDVQAALNAGFDTRVDIVEGGLTYSISARDLILADARTRWIEGPLATEVRVSGVPRAGGVSHPALGVRFDVRFLGSASARVSVVVENTFHDTPGNRTYDVRVTPAGVSAPAFERAGLTHFYHSRWRTIVGWREAPSTLAIAIDARRLVEAGAIPNYDRSVAVDPAAVTDLIDRWRATNREPMATGIVVGAMPMAGGRWDIGPLPTWTALALLSADPRAYRVVMDAGERAASFSSHLRDRADGLIYTIDRHPTTSINPRNSAVGRDADPADLLPLCSNCESPYIVDRAHQPSLAYVPYLASGDAYFWDELKFWANYNFLENNARPYYSDPARGFSLGLLQQDEPRGQAWSLRTLGHAAWIAPEDDAHRSYFTSKLANNLTWYAQNAAGSNPFGWWSGFDASSNGRPQPNFSAETSWSNQPWQNDFLLIAFDGLIRMGFTDARPTRDWLALWTIGRFTRSDYNPNEGDAYALAVRGTGGRVYSSWAEIYQQSTMNRTTPAPTALSSLECPFCYAAIARAALAGPVRDRVTDANQAREFIAVQLAPHNATLNRDPTWAIVP